MGEDRAKELQEFFRLSLDLLAVAGFDGRFRMVTPSWETILGYPEDELLSRPFLDFVHPEDRERTETETARLTRGDVAVAFENRYRTRSGSYRTLLWNASSSVDNQRIYAVARDVTVQRVQELRLRLASHLATRLAHAEDVREALQAIVEESVRTIRWDVGEAWIRRGTELAHSPSWYSDNPVFAGFRAASRGYQFVHGDGLPGRAWAEGRPVWVQDVGEEAGYQRRDLVKQFGLRTALAVPLKDAENDVAAVAVFYSRDLRDRDPELEELLEAVSTQVGGVVRRREAEEARQWLASIVESAEEGVIGCGRDELRVLSCNAAAGPLFGIDPRDALGKRFDELLGAGGPHAPLAEAVQRCVTAGRGEHLSLRTGRKALTAAISPVRSALGELVGASLLARDVTEEYRLSERLRAAQRMASLGTLSAGVAHEVNNPLTSVISSLDVALRELFELSGGSPASRLRDLEEVVGEARQGAERVRRIVRGLHAFAQPPTEREPVPLPLSHVLDMAIRMARNEVRHRARIVRDYGVVSPVRADETRLAQLFVNLLVNAAHAIEPGDPDANEVRIVTYTDDRGYAVAEVRDTGAGIPQDALPRIFDPFFTTKEVGAGTGLGLAICHGIAAVHGGELEAESTVGEGSTFRLTLPPVENLPAVKPSLRPMAQSTVPPRRHRVLVVDDDALVARAFVRILSRAYDVEVASTGEEALEHLQGGEVFDVILCDLSMPGMGGAGLHRHLCETRPELEDALVVVTGGGDRWRGTPFPVRVGAAPSGEAGGSADAPRRGPAGDRRSGPGGRLIVAPVGDRHPAARVRPALPICP